MDSLEFFLNILFPLVLRLKVKNACLFIAERPKIQKEKIQQNTSQCPIQYFKFVMIYITLLFKDFIAYGLSQELILLNCLKIFSRSSKHLSCNIILDRSAGPVSRPMASFQPQSHHYRSTSPGTSNQKWEPRSWLCSSSVHF